MNEFYDFVKLLTTLSGKIIRENYQSQFSVEFKDDGTPVTMVDQKVEEMLRNHIMKFYPDHGILGEEFGEYNPESEYQWILDPIDGTKSFVHGFPTFGTLIALLKNKKPVIGAIHLPLSDNLLIGDDKKTRLDGKTAKLRDTEDLSSCFLLTTDHLNVEKYQNIQKFNQLIHKVKLYRTWGNCYGYFMVATGQADIMIDPIMSLWDIMALIPVIKGAGGKITDYHGNDPATGSSIIAANPKIHEQVIKMLNE